MSIFVDNEIDCDSEETILVERIFEYWLSDTTAHNKIYDMSVSFF